MGRNSMSVLEGGPSSPVVGTVAQTLATRSARTEVTKARCGAHKAWSEAAASMPHNMSSTLHSAQCHSWRGVATAGQDACLGGESFIHHMPVLSTLYFKLPVQLAPHAPEHRSAPLWAAPSIAAENMSHVTLTASRSHRSRALLPRLGKHTVGTPVHTQELPLCWTLAAACLHPFPGSKTSCP